MAFTKRPVPSIPRPAGPRKPRVGKIGTKGKVTVKRPSTGVPRPKRPSY
jgi:hypothetical protein